MGQDTRTYIKLHDGMPDHPKIDALSDKAFRLLIGIWCWCSRHLTDGIVPETTWSKRGSKAAREELLEAGLAEPHPEGIYMHDYLDHQRSADEVRALREARREAGKLGGKAKANALASAKANAKQTSSKNVAETDTDTETESETPKTLTSTGVDFDEFWKQYPTRPNTGSKGSRKNALTIWKKLSPEKRSKALTSLPVYAKAKNGYPKDAERYLRGEEWDGLEVVSLPESEYAWL